MSYRSSQDELPTRGSTNTLTYLVTCVLDGDHIALEEFLVNNPVQQSDLDRCLLRGLQRIEKALLRVKQTLTILLQAGAIWRSGALLDDQKTPYHIICESEDDEYNLLELLIKSCQQTIIDKQDSYMHTAMMYAVKNYNTNCLQSLLTSGADLTIGIDVYLINYLDNIDLLMFIDNINLWTPIMEAIWRLSRYGRRHSYMCDIFELLLDNAVEQYKDHFSSCTDYILCAIFAGNVYCIRRLIENGAPLNSIAYNGLYVWAIVAGKGDVKLLQCMFNRGIDKDFIDQHGYSMLWHAVSSGNIETVRYLLDIGVAIPTYAPKVLEKQCEQCGENTLMIDSDREQEDRDPCMAAICNNMLEIVKMLDEYGNQSCKSYTALRRAVQCRSVDVVFFLLNKYSYPLNKEYIIKDFFHGKNILTLLSEAPSVFTPSSSCAARITKLLLDHGADPAKTMCGPTSANAIMTAIDYEYIEVIAQYIRSGVNINLRSWNYNYGKVLPFQASVLHDSHYISVMLLISGCTRGSFSTHKFNANPKPDLEKLMKEWNVYDNIVTPLQLRCRCVILNHLSPRADVKIEKLPVPPCLIKFLSISELDNIVYEYKKLIEAD